MQFKVSATKWTKQTGSMFADLFVVSNSMIALSFVVSLPFAVSSIDVILPLAKCKYILRAWRCTSRIHQRPADYGESSQDDKHTHPAAIRILFASVMFTEKWNSHLQIGEPGRGATWRSYCEHAVRGADGWKYQLQITLQQEEPATQLEQSRVEQSFGTNRTWILRSLVSLEPVSIEESNMLNLNQNNAIFCRLVDNLPVATRVLNPDTKELQLEHGYRLGFVMKGNAYINNHLKFILSYHMHTK